MASDVRRLWTSESVTEGHPDKVADQVSDSVLDAILAQDPMGRVAVEAMLTGGVAIVAGEITTECYVDIASIVRKTITGIGYDEASHGFSGDTCGVLVAIQEQSPDIAQGVDAGGAGDQGMMFGFACDETPELMPAPIIYAHRLTRGLSEARRDGSLPWLRPDGKSQVTVEYDDGRPVRIAAVVIAAHHAPEVESCTVERDVTERVVRRCVPPELMDDRTEILVNRTGRFEVGGPLADTGLTGRKIIVDTYGGLARHGGGCFSGKDPSKVDRSAAYMVRYLAKNVVAAGIARKCEIEIAYCIGRPEPVSLAVDTFGTGEVPDTRIEAVLTALFDLRPRAIIDRLDLRRPIYRSTAAYGHFGRLEPEFTWERTDSADAIRGALA